MSRLRDSGFTRRQMLRAGAVVSAVAAVPGLPAVARAGTLLPRYRRSSYKQLTDRTFYARRPGTLRWLRIRLWSISDLPAATTVPTLRGHEHAFALRFEGPAGGTQLMYELKHPRFGTFKMFLAPRGVPVNGRQRYDAVIDRSHAPSRAFPAPTAA